MLEHGGGVIAAAQKHGIPVSDWLDLSTGINPKGYPVPPVPASAWQRLPEREDALIAAARAYYGASDLLPVAGSQAAITSLPALRARGTVGLLCPSYAEHSHAWKKHRHKILSLQATSLEAAVAGIDAAVDKLDVLILCNPNNPTGWRFSPDTLQGWHSRLARGGGWLIVDEAFADDEPEFSLSGGCRQEGLIVLRSLGKFFGLAGARVGFVLAWRELLNLLDEHLGPWTISGPSRFTSICALQDRIWQDQAARQLRADALRLTSLLQKHALSQTSSTNFFCWIPWDHARHLHEFLLSQGILTRLFTDPPGIRLGLPSKEEQWLRLDNALKNFHRLHE